MTYLDHGAAFLFFLVMIFIGIVSYRRIHASSDFFVAGGKVPWWLAGISHHVSGYSGVVFVAYAGITCQYGFTLYVWWAFNIANACIIGAFVFAPRWCGCAENSGSNRPPSTWRFATMSHHPESRKGRNRGY